ncbi:hypothetical protein HOE22_07325 [Candidatus Woesearchaeota archaeon]|jgi:hypothetical protein|nr:hypothetical protein [Candidatus Woesearchaeota archaeon]MBT4731725.1 hypothetical protein [Candidatus Woesearchaeota archaeon]MBT7557148.1 hypothetical protein [Candidatus Woesearchaeota archaeon]
MIENILWTLLGVFIGSIGGILIISLLTSSKTEDLHMEIQDLRTQRQLLKEEIFRLSNQAKPKPRKKRSRKPKNK